MSDLMTYNKEQIEYECKDLLMTIIDDTKTLNKNYIIHTHICAYPFVCALLLLNYWSIRKRKRGPNWFGRTAEARVRIASEAIPLRSPQNRFYVCVSPYIDQRVHIT